MRRSGAKIELEAEFGAGGETEGTLILTNRRIIFVTTNEKEDDLPEPSLLNPFTKEPIYFSEVEDIDSIPAAKGNLFIQIPSIVSVTGRNPKLERPHLQVEWLEGRDSRSAVFIETLTGSSRKKNLSDWAPVVEKLKAGTLVLVSLPQAPSVETLEGKILWVLGDMQDKGLFEIQGEVERQFKLEPELDPDDVEKACENLVSTGVIAKQDDPSGDSFFRKRSPLGEDDLPS